MGRVRHALSPPSLILGMTMSVWPILFSIVIGIVVSLLVLLPPIHKLSQKNVQTRVGIICVVGILSLLLCMGLLARLGAEISYYFGFVTSTSIDAPEYERNKSAIVTELWIRTLLPPAMEQSCNTPDTRICRIADSMAPREVLWQKRVESFIQWLAINSVSGLTSAAFAWLFTRHRQGSFDLTNVSDV